MKNIIVILFVALCVASCKKEYVKGAPDCVNDYIKRLNKSGGHFNVHSYDYKGATYYEVGCVLFDNNCNEVCQCNYNDINLHCDSIQRDLKNKKTVYSK